MSSSVFQKHGKWITMKDGHTLIKSKPSFSNILFTDGKTKLLDYVSNMDNTKTFNSFLQNIDVNISISRNSPVWPGSTPLHLAVMLSENPENEDKAFHIVKQLLDQGALVQVQDRRGATPLHLAFCLEQQQIIALLLRILEDKSLKVSNLVDDKNLSFLHISCTTSDHRSSLARKLLSKEKTIRSTVDLAYNGKSLSSVKEGWTPLLVAASQCQVSLVELLLQRGANLLSTDTQGSTAIHRLFGTNQKSLADALFASEQLIDCVSEKNGLTHLHVAVYFNGIKSVERLLDLGAEVEATVGKEGKESEKFSGCTPLRIALIMDHWKIVKLLVQFGANVLAKMPDGTSSLSEALLKNRRYGSKATRELLQSIISDENLQNHLKEELGLTKLHIACNSLETESVEELLKKGADVNAKLHSDSHFWAGYTPLHALVASNDWGDKIVILKNLLDNGCNVDQQDISGQTAFHVLLESKRLYEVRDITAVLLSVGADINIVDKTGRTPFSYALKLHHLCQYSWDFNNFNSAIRGFILYIRKMKLLALEVSELNETSTASALLKYPLRPEYCDESGFYDRVQATDKIKIGHRGLNVRSFLCETGAVSRYPSLSPEHRDEVATFHRSFNDLNLFDVVPLFRLQYRKAVGRLSVIDPARDTLKTFIHSGFPDLCIDIILKYLSNSQLKLLITAATIEDNTA